jgi:hypothetical protein
LGSQAPGQEQAQAANQAETSRKRSRHTIAADEVMDAIRELRERDGIDDVFGRVLDDEGN